MRNSDPDHLARAWVWPFLPALLIIVCTAQSLRAEPSGRTPGAASFPEIKPRAPAPAEDPAYCSALAQIHLQFGHPELAIPLLEKAVAAPAAAAETGRRRLALARAWVVAGDEAKGLGLLEELAKSDDAALRAITLATLGGYYESKEDPAKALSYYDKAALSSAGEFQRAAMRKTIARIVAASKDPEAEARRYEAMLLDHPDDLNLVSLVAEVDSALKRDPRRVADLFGKVHADRPDDAEAWMRYILALESAGKSDQAAAELKALKEKKPDYHQYCCENLARLAKAQGRPDEARKWVAESLTGLEDTPLRSLRAGRVYLALDMPQDAEMLLFAASIKGETDGLRAEATLDLASALMKMKRYKEAAALLDPLRSAPWASVKEKAVQLWTICDKMAAAGTGSEPKR